VHYRPLGRTGLTVSEIGLGCASYWGMRAFDERRAVALVHAAIDRGVTLFDTGPSYSAGNAEPRLGRALAGRAAGLVVSTKVGTVRDAAGRLGKDFTPRGVVASVEASLRRLGLDSIAILYLHGPREADLGDDLLAALEALRRRGLVRHVGINADDAVLWRAVALAPFDVVMPLYNALRREMAPLIAAAAAAGKGVIAGAPLAHAVFSPAAFRPWRRAGLWYLLRALGRHRADLVRARALRAALDVPGWTPAAVALAYVLANPAVAAAIVGTTDPRHLADNLDASGRRLPPEVLARLNAL